MAKGKEAHTDVVQTRALVLSALRSSEIEFLNPERPGRYLLVAKVDNDSLSDRWAAFHPSKEAACKAITDVPAGWWPDCLIDLDATIELAVQDAAVGDGSLGDPYPFDPDHVIFA